MNKILFFILTLTLTLSFFCVSAFAESEGGVGADGVTDSQDSAEQVSEEDGENIFSELYGVALRHADKIFSALAFLGSILIAFAYKKGLLPVIKGALSAMGAATAKLKEEAKSATDKAAEAVSAAGTKLEIAEGMLRMLTGKLDDLKAELDKAREEQERCGEFKIILSSQIDMLYEIFMSSSLPQYQKEAVGNKIAEMKRHLTPCSVNTKDESYE